jgi:hypothetical protein
VAAEHADAIDVDAVDRLGAEQAQDEPHVANAVRRRLRAAQDRQGLDLGSRDRPSRLVRPRVVISRAELRVPRAARRGQRRAADGERCEREDAAGPAGPRSARRR